MQLPAPATRPRRRVPAALALLAASAIACSAVVLRAAEVSPHPTPRAAHPATEMNREEMNREDGGAVDFVRDVRPILAEQCFSCHGPEKHKGDLRLDSRSAALSGGHVRPHHPPRSRRRQQPDPAGARAGRRRPHAAEEAAAPGGAGATPRRLDRPGGEVARRGGRGVGRPSEALGVRQARPPRRARGAGPGVGAQPDRPFRPGPPGEGGRQAFAAGDQADAAPPGQPRPDRPAAVAGGGRSLPGRRLARRLREGGGPPARLAALRRAVGPALAGRRPLRRLQRLQHRRAALDLEVPRLGDRRDQPRPALRPVRRRATGRRPAPRRHARTKGRHRLPPQHADQRGRRHRPRAVPRRGGDRPRRHHRHRLPRPDRRLRPVPQPQVRPHFAEGVLPALLLLQQRRRADAADHDATGGPPAARAARADRGGEGVERIERIARVEGKGGEQGCRRFGRGPEEAGGGNRRDDAGDERARRAAAVVRVHQGRLHPPRRPGHAGRAGRAAAAEAARTGRAPAGPTASTWPGGSSIPKTRSPPASR